MFNKTKFNSFSYVEKMGMYVLILERISLHSRCNTMINVQMSYSNSLYGVNSFEVVRHLYLFFFSN